MACTKPSVREIRILFYYFFYLQNCSGIVKEQKYGSGNEENDVLL